MCLEKHMQVSAKNIAKFKAATKALNAAIAACKNDCANDYTCVAEECSELAQNALRVAQAANKALRFGLDDGYPRTDRTNRADLVREFNDLVDALEGLQDCGVELPGLFDRAAIDAKKAKILKWMGHAESIGTLQR
jgi:hypothetical protein